MTERKPLPGGYYWRVSPLSPLNTFGDIYNPDGLIIAEDMKVKNADLFCKAMNDAAELTSRKVIELSNRRGKSVTPPLHRVESEAAGLREVLVKAKDGLVCCRHLMLKYGDTKDHFWLGQMDADIEAIKTALKGPNEIKEV